MANEGVNFSTEPGVSSFLLLRMAPGAAGSTGAWVNIGGHRLNPVIMCRGNLTTTVGITFQTHVSDDTPTASTVGINVQATITAVGVQATAPSSVLIGTWVRAIANNTTTGGTVEAYYVGNLPEIHR